MCVSTWGGTGLLGYLKAKRAWGLCRGLVEDSGESPGPAREAGQGCRAGHRAGAHLADVVEVSVWHLLLRSQLLHLVEQHVHLKLGAQVL